MRAHTGTISMSAPPWAKLLFIAKQEVTPTLVLVFGSSVTTGRVSYGVGLSGGHGLS